MKGREAGRSSQRRKKNVSLSTEIPAFLMLRNGLFTAIKLHVPSILY